MGRFYSILRRAASRPETLKKILMVVCMAMILLSIALNRRITRITGSGFALVFLYCCWSLNRGKK